MKNMSDFLIDDTVAIGNEPVKKNDTIKIVIIDEMFPENTDTSQSPNTRNSTMMSTVRPNPNIS